MKQMNIKDIKIIEKRVQGYSLLDDMFGTEI